MIKKCPPYNAGSEIYIVAFWRKKMSLIPNNAVVFSALKQGKKGNSVGKQIYPFFEYHFPSKILVRGDAKKTGLSMFFYD